MAWKNLTQCNLTEAMLTFKEYHDQLDETFENWWS
jgi:hypothetical protein